MQKILKAGMLYFAMVFLAGCAFGIVRTLVLAPLVGQLIAVILELPFMLAIAWITCGWVLQRIPVPQKLLHRIAMGAFAFILLMVAEAVISTQFAGLDLTRHFALYKTLPVIVGLLGQIAFALFPVLRTSHHVVRSQ